MDQRTWLAIVNEHAGKKTTQKWPALHDKLLGHGICVDVQRTEAPGHAREIAAHGLLSGYTGIIAAGGDGTLNEAVNGFWQNTKLINPEAALTFINLGTGGDFARFATEVGAATFEADTAPTPDPVDRLLHGRLQAVDIGLAQFAAEGSETQRRYFINVANVGIGAESAQRVNRQKAKHGSGTLSFLKGTLATLLKYKPQPLRIVIDDDCKLDEEIYGVMVCNGRYIGAGMMIAPQAQITDALFDIIVIRKMSLVKLLSNFPKIYRGAHLDVPDIEFWRGSQVEIGGSLEAPSGRKALVELDGEILGICPASYTLLPQALLLWLPE
ncbi:MAG: diacylglycerol kinase family lipid kinase [Peptococcaceae bacterium]|nr:diacylglycerol kinase family lipid kinase [Peptococcaceae bacterium]